MSPAEAGQLQVIPHFALFPQLFPTFPLSGVPAGRSGRQRGLGCQRAADRLLPGQLRPEELADARRAVARGPPHRAQDQPGSGEAVPKMQLKLELPRYSAMHLTWPAPGSLNTQQP